MYKRQLPEAWREPEDLRVCRIHACLDPAEEGRADGFHAGEVLHGFPGCRVLHRLIDPMPVRVAMHQHHLPGEGLRFFAQLDQEVAIAGVRFAGIGLLEPRVGLDVYKRQVRFRAPSNSKCFRGSSHYHL